MGNLGDSSGLHLAGFLHWKAENKRGLSDLTIILELEFHGREALACGSA